MRILHVVESLANAGGGLPAAVKSLMLLQQTNGYQVECSETSGNATLPLENGVTLRSLERSLSKLIQLCREITRKRYQLVHIHGLWDIFYPFICIACKLGNVKYVVTTHGQLLSTILQADKPAKRFKKRIYHAAVSNWILRGATRIHVSSGNEIREFSAHSHLAAKTDFIPHIIDPVFFDNHAHEHNASIEGGASFRDILFVGRLDRRKGLLDLIDGFIASNLPHPWRLRIVGPAGDPAFMAEMAAKISQSGMPGKIFLEPPVYGNARAALYLSSYIFCLPSYSEAPGLVNIEAALLGRPVLTTPNTGLYTLDKSGGVLCETGGASIANALTSIGNWDKDEYAARSALIRSWAMEDYSLDAIVPRWKRFYALSVA